jgi:deferrochelatase/peroxidase EfeB
MPSRVMGRAGDGRRDKLMEFTYAVSGANFFAPSLQVLKTLGKPHALIALGTVDQHNCC